MGLGATRRRSDELSSRSGFWETRCSRITVHMRNPMGRRRRGARGDSSMFSRGGGGLVSFDLFLFSVSVSVVALGGWEWWWCQCLLGFRLHLGRREEELRDELSRGPGEMMASAHTPHRQVFGGAFIPSVFPISSGPVFESGSVGVSPYLPCPSLARAPRIDVCRAADLTCKLLLETRRLAIAPPLPAQPARRTACPTPTPTPSFLSDRPRETWHLI